jgi:predicted secreted protein
VFEDQRSKKVMLVAHCVLNQNAKIDQCAHYPGAVPDVAAALIEAGIGIVQMPCPELLFLGLDRQADRNTPATVEAEDTRVAKCMASAQGKQFCRHLAHDLAYQVEDYQKNGFEVLGILGINGSPTCGVETNWAEDWEAPGPGVFMQLLIAELAGRGITLPVRGIKVTDLPRALAAVSALCGGE